MNTPRRFALTALLLVGSLPALAQDWGYPPVPYQVPPPPLAAPPWAAPPQHADIAIRRSLDEDGSYLIDLRLIGVQPEQVRIRAGRGRLVIRAEQATGARQAGPYGGWQGGGYVSFRRTLPLPRDADVAHISTSETPSGMRIRLPRRGRGDAE